MTERTPVLLERYEQPELVPLVERLSGLDGPADEVGDWPEGLWKALEEFQAPLWSIPEEYGGRGLDLPERAARDVIVAEGSLTAAFILSQFNASTRRLTATAHQGRERAAKWLRAIAGEGAFTTVGLSQLTTSKRRGTRAMAAQALPNGGYRLDGVMPWVTGAKRAAVFVTGAVLDDGRQVLAALPGDRDGVTVGDAMPLTALQASQTAEVRCEGVELEPEEVLFGPDPDVLSASSGGAGAGGLETSALAIGQARAALKALRDLSPNREELNEPVEALEAAWASLAADLIAVAEARPDAPEPADLRTRANAFVLRATQGYLTARKGTGFLKTEPAQRWARQALFFLVWSCPGPVAQAALRDFAGICSA